MFGAGNARGGGMAKQPFDAGHGPEPWEMSGDMAMSVEWDDLLLGTGSVMRREGRYWAAYSASSTTDSSFEERYRVQRVGIAVSEDLISWEKLPENPENGTGHRSPLETASRPCTILAKAAGWSRGKR